MNYALSGGNAHTLEAGKIILDQGGNAVDAAIAAYLVSFISEPCMASLGAGGFATVNDNKSIHVVDFFCQTPLRKLPTSQQEFFPITVDFGNTTEDFMIGKGSVATPGALAGIYKMHELWGKLPINTLIEPALIWAKEGLPIDDFQAYDLQLLKDIFSVDPSANHLFFKKDGTLKNAGDTLKMPNFHDFLTALLHEGKDLFYKGEVSKIIDKEFFHQGHLSRKDFENYEAIVRKPIEFDFYGNKVSTTPFPSVGGMLLSSILNHFQDANFENFIEPFTETHFQSLVSVFADIKKLQNKPELISRYLINNFGINVNTSNTSGKKWNGTSHFNIVDKDGMTVSLTTSIGEGAGYFIPGTDMQMNNMLGEEALMPNGFNNWDNDVRLQSMMCPTLVTNANGTTKIAIGTGGAGRIPYIIAQVLINLLKLHLPPISVINAPRLYLSEEKIQIEKGFNFDKSFFENIHEWENQSLYFGGVNMVSRERNNLMAYADDRRKGKFLIGS